MQQIPASLLTLIAGVLITLVSLWVGQHHNLLPEQASQQAPLVDNFFSIMVTIGTALFLIVQGAILIFTIAFRQRKGDETDGEPIEGNFALEIVWTAIPSIIVIGLGIYSVDVYQQMGGFAPVGSHAMISHSHHQSAIAAPLIAQADNKAPDLPTYGLQTNSAGDTKPADVIVNVAAMQYAWLFNYTNPEITAGELHVPIGKEVQLNITGQDVIHSFWVPQFRLKQDALPGLKNELRFVATKLGTYPIVCAELCGSYHGSMRSQVVVETQEAYDQWLKDSQIAQANPPVVVALNPVERSDSEFLAPYAKEIGIIATDLAPLQAHP